MQVIINFHSKKRKGGSKHKRTMNNTSNIFNEFPVKEDQIKKNHQILRTNLLHLEFIHKFETYLDAKNMHAFPVAFLQELESVKRDIQLKTLNTSERLNQKLAEAI